MSREQVLIKFTNHSAELRSIIVLNVKYLSHNGHLCRIRSKLFYIVSRIRLIYDNFASWTYLDSRRKDAETISEILLRAASEPEFRNQLVKEPTKILEQYNISAEAKSIIKTSIADLTQ
jgi:hypothetical protein